MRTQVCSWCQVEGVRTVIEWGDEPEESHGCCAYHATQLEAEAFESYLKRHPEELARRTGEAP